MNHSSQQRNYASSMPQHGTKFESSSAPNCTMNNLPVVQDWYKIMLLSRGWAGKEERQTENVPGQLFIYRPGICHGLEAVWIKGGHETMRGLFYAERMLPSNKKGFCMERKWDKDQEKCNTVRFKRKMPDSRKMREEICQPHSTKQHHAVCTENLVRKTVQERIWNYKVSEFQPVPERRLSDSIMPVLG